jgi:hypothetical protein
MPKLTAIFLGKLNELPRPEARQVWIKPLNRYVCGQIMHEEEVNINEKEKEKKIPEPTSIRTSAPTSTV